MSDKDCPPPLWPPPDAVEGIFALGGKETAQTWADPGVVRAAHAQRKLQRLERLMEIWANGNDVVLAKAAAKVLRQLSEEP